MEELNFQRVLFDYFLNFKISFFFLNIIKWKTISFDFADIFLFKSFVCDQYIIYKMRKEKNGNYNKYWLIKYYSRRKQCNHCNFKVKINICFEN